MKSLLKFARVVKIMASGSSAPSVSWTKPMEPRNVLPSELNRDSSDALISSVSLAASVVVRTNDDVASPAVTTAEIHEASSSGTTTLRPLEEMIPVTYSPPSTGTTYLVLSRVRYADD